MPTDQDQDDFLEDAIDLMHVFDTTCVAAEQSQVSGKPYQNATLTYPDEGLCATSIRISFAPPGNPLQYGKRYRVTIEELAS